jgi:hypothetical protein
MVKRHKAPQHTRDRRRKRQEEAGRKKKLLAMLKPLHILLGVIASLASLLAINSFVPKLAVAPGPTLNVHDPFATIFSLKNDGILPVHDVTEVFCINDFDNPTNHQRIFGGKIAFGNTNLGDLRAGDTVGLPFDKAFGGFPDADADIEFIVQFRPEWWPFRREKRFRFVTDREYDRGWAWKALPLGKPCR